MADKNKNNNQTTKKSPVLRIIILIIALFMFVGAIALPFIQAMRAM